MATIFYELCTFFGITAEAPETLGELFPWLSQVLVAMALVYFAFSMISGIVKTICRGRF